MTVVKKDFIALSDVLTQLLDGKETELLSQSAFQDFLQQAQDENPWFVQEHIRYALSQITSALTEPNLKKWLSAYPEISKQKPAKTVALIMAGNIPLVGFHDMLSVLISGHNLKAKLSSKDRILPKMIRELLVKINQEYDRKILFTEEQLFGFDAVIATGSNNSANVFKQYFGKYPHIIRQNRNSIAILTGDETPEELQNLGHDIFSYFGLGCRNVSKIFVPEDYPVAELSSYFTDFSHYQHHNKYINNYDYQKAIALMNQTEFIDGNFFLMQERREIASPISVIFYERYTDYRQLKLQLTGIKNQLQVVVSKESSNFELTQQPQLWDYADGVDTVAFLLNI